MCGSVNYFFGSQVNWIMLRVLIVEEIVASEEEVGESREYEEASASLVGSFRTERIYLKKKKGIQWPGGKWRRKEGTKNGKKKENRIRREKQMNEELL